MPFITNNNCRLYYELHGQGEPLLFIHGLGSSTRDWEDQIATFAAAFQVILIDLRGHGQSDKPAGPYRISMFADDAAKLLEALNVKQAHIVGISLGGGVAFQLVLDHPELVKTLTIVNSAPMTSTNEAATVQEIERRVAIVQQMGMRAMGEALSPNLFPKPEHAALRELFNQRWSENDPQAYIAATRSLLSWDVTNQIHAISCPTLILSADQDYTPLAIKEAYIKLMPNAQLVVLPNTHHAVPMEDPVQFNDALMSFLKQHSV